MNIERPAFLMNNLPGLFRYCRRCKAWFNEANVRLGAQPTGGAFTFRNKVCKDRGCAGEESQNDQPTT